MVVEWALGGEVPSGLTLRRYEYVSPPLSLFERWWLDRFWSRLPGRVYPKWLAPNVITVAGLVAVACGFAAVACASPRLDGASTGPGTYAALSGLIALYQTLDGSDGKQARFTGTGSALGEVVDHGVDALTTVLITVACADLAQLGATSALVWALVVLASCAFYLSNLTLVHTGRQQFHDVDVQELLVALEATCAVCAAFGLRRRRRRRPAPGNMMMMMGPTLMDDNDESRRAVASFVVVCAILGMVVNCSQLVGALLGDDFARKSSSSSSSKAAAAVVRRQLAALAVYCLAVAANVLLPRGSAHFDAAPRAFWVPLAVAATAAFGDLARRALLLRVARLRAPAADLAPPTMLALAALAAVADPLARAAVAALAALAYFVAAARTIDATAAALGIRPFSTTRMKNTHVS